MRFEIDACAPQRHEVVVQVAIPRVGGDGSEIERFGRPNLAGLKSSDGVSGHSATQSPLDGAARRAVRPRHRPGRVVLVLSLRDYDSERPVVSHDVVADLERISRDRPGVQGKCVSFSVVKDHVGAVAVNSIQGPALLGGGPDDAAAFAKLVKSVI